MSAITATVPLEITRMVRDNCLCLRVQRASRAIGRMFDDAFRPYGLTNFQFSLLMMLNRPSPPTIGGLAENLAMDRTTITANLKPLERRRLVSVHRDDEDFAGQAGYLDHCRSFTADEMREGLASGE